MTPSSSLNQVVAFIQPFQLEAVVDALRRLPRFPGMSVSDVMGMGAHRAHAPLEGEETEVHPFQKKVRLEIYCLSSDLVAIVETIRKVAHTGHAGDGKIFAGQATLACRIRTAEWGEGAILAGRS